MNRRDLGLDFVLLPDAHELLLLGGCLETTVTELGGGIDELGSDLLQLPPLGRAEEGLPDGDDALLRTDDGTLDHDVVLIDLTIVGEATHGGNALLSEIELSRGIVVHDLATLLTNSLACYKHKGQWLAEILRKREK